MSTPFETTSEQTVADSRVPDETRDAGSISTDDTRVAATAAIREEGDR